MMNCLLLIVVVYRFPWESYLLERPESLHCKPIDLVRVSEKWLLNLLQPSHFAVEKGHAEAWVRHGSVLVESDCHSLLQVWAQVDCEDDVKHSVRNVSTVLGRIEAHREYQSIPLVEFHSLTKKKLMMKSHLWACQLVLVNSSC